MFRMSNRESLLYGIIYTISSQKGLAGETLLWGDCLRLQPSLTLTPKLYQPLRMAARTQQPRTGLPWQLQHPLADKTIVTLWTAEKRNVFKGLPTL
jgi:hypothetical protein